MGLRDWVAATATLATPATVEGGTGRSVATVATVAVARAANGAPPPVATSEQAAELRALVPRVCEVVGEADVDKALADAIADPEAAVTCFRAIAADLQQPLLAKDGDEQARTV
jgi:hypothetical protein